MFISHTCSWKAEQGLSSETIAVYQGKHVHDKAKQGFSETTETIDIYHGIYVHDIAEQGLSSENIEVYQGKTSMTKLSKDVHDRKLPINS